MTSVVAGRVDRVRHRRAGPARRAAAADTGGSQRGPAAATSPTIATTEHAKGAGPEGPAPFLKRVAIERCYLVSVKVPLAMTSFLRPFGALRVAVWHALLASSA